MTSATFLRDRILELHNMQGFYAENGQDGIAKLRDTPESTWFSWM